MDFIKIHKLIFIALLLTANTHAETFVVAPKKKQPKLTVEQVCLNMMPENIISARINSLLGQNQATGLCWIDDVMEENKNALFNLATQELLQKFNQELEQYIKELQHFEDVLQAHREFLKNWKQEVLSAKKK